MGPFPLIATPFHLIATPLLAWLVSRSASRTIGSAREGHDAHDAHGQVSDQDPLTEEEFFALGQGRLGDWPDVEETEVGETEQCKGLR